MAVSRTWHALVANDTHIWKCKLQEADYSTDIADVPESPNPYKSLYERYHKLRQNWNHNRCTRKQLEGHANHVVTCLQFDDDKIVTGSDDHHVNIYDIKTGELRRTLEGHDGGVWALQYIGNTLVTGSTDRTIRIWDMDTGRCRHIFRGHGSTVRCLTIVTPTRTRSGQLEPRRTLLVSGSRDHTVRVWELPSMENSTIDSEARTSEHMYQRHKLVGHEGSVRALAAHGSMLASGSYDNTVRIWNISTGRLQHVLKGHEQKVYTVVIDGERGKCISGSMDSTVRIWDMASGACDRILQGHHILVGLLGLSPNYLVSAAADQTLRVWSPRTGQCYHTLFGHKAAITSFQHDEHKVISGSEGSLRMWDIKTGKYMHELISDINGVWRVAFNERWCVAAVRRWEKTRIEVMDFGAGCF
ncbi:WD40-repeat-containing domain protein [Syncephalastrum racemosum]|uniref:WD40-repeat-containing domain protein n=1 Tax=Syncephalastrum racemosum TaxID=13706 RepID=A0A1X2HMY5_SYNRA|nr:WD40-repeat-containing domain protein [Syncephalastrum racemosum]